MPAARGEQTPRRAWTDAERAASIQADLRHLTDQRLAAWQRRELALLAKVRAMEQTHAAHAEAARAVEEIDNLSREIAEQDRRASRADPETAAVMRWRRLHGLLTIVWFAMIPVSLLTGLRQSVPYLVAISVYALAASHFAAWQGSRAEDSE